MPKKLLVETTGDFQFLDQSHENPLVQSSRPTVVTNSLFIQSKIASDQIRVLGEVSNKADDAAFEDTLKNSKDKEMAVSAFLSEFALDKSEPEPEPEKPTGRSRRK